MPNLLSIRGLTTYYRVLRGFIRAVEDISLNINEKEALGLAGESGCGKTTVALSILKILPPEGFIKSGQILFRDIDITKLDEEQMRLNIRWKKIAIVFQGAMNALNPVYTIGQQITEAITLHEPEVTKHEALERAQKLLELVGIDPSRINNYPHEFSGGMRQRAMIAMALACNPELLIADEPGTALDVIVQAQVLKLLKELKQKLGLAMILITHDLSLITETCDKVAIMYAGRIVETGSVREVFKNPQHPYTQGLIRAFPDMLAPKTRLSSIPGFPPDLLAPPPGCRFNPRCSYVMDTCKKNVPALTHVEGEHYVACHLIR
ncbi:MAG: ABC transporter ATP-binding protein [Candidatus Bathyarchaeia archaeon]